MLACLAGDGAAGRPPEVSTSSYVEEEPVAQLATLVVDRCHLSATCALFGSSTANVRATVRCLGRTNGLRDRSLRDAVAVVLRGGAPAATMARDVQRAGALGLVLINHDDRPWCPSADGTSEAVRIPVVVVAAAVAARLVDGAEVALTIGDTARDYASPRDAAQLLEAESSPRRHRSLSRARTTSRRRASSSGSDERRSPLRRADERVHSPVSWRSRSPSPPLRRAPSSPGATLVSSATPKQRPTRRRRQEQLLHSVQKSLSERPLRATSAPRRRRYASSDDDSEAEPDDAGGALPPRGGRSLLFMFLDAVMVETKLLVVRHGFLAVGGTVLIAITVLALLRSLLGLLPSPALAAPSVYRMGDGALAQGGTLSMDGVMYIALCGLALMLLSSDGGGAAARSVYTAAQRHASATRRHAAEGVPLAPRLVIPDNALSVDPSPHMAGELPPPKRLGSTSSVVMQQPSWAGSAIRSTSPSFAEQTPVRNSAAADGSASVFVTVMPAEQQSVRRSLLMPPSEPEQQPAAAVIPTISSLSTRRRPSERLAALEAAEMAAAKERKRQAGIYRKGRAAAVAAAPPQPEPEPEHSYVSAVLSEDQVAALSGVWEAVGKDHTRGPDVTESLRLSFREDGSVFGGPVQRLGHEDRSPEVVDAATGDIFKLVDGRVDVSGWLSFTQLYRDGAATRWEARLTSYSATADAAVAGGQPEMIGGSWEGDCNGFFTARLLHSLSPLKADTETVTVLRHRRAGQQDDASSGEVERAGAAKLEAELEEISGVLASQEAAVDIRMEVARHPRTDTGSGREGSLSPVQRMYTHRASSPTPAHQGNASDAVLVNSQAPEQEPATAATSATVFEDPRLRRVAAVRTTKRIVRHPDSPVRMVSPNRQRSPESVRVRRANRPDAAAAAERSDIAQEEFLMARLARAKSRSLSPRQKRAAGANKEDEGDGVRSASSWLDPGGRQAAERSAMRALRMEREQQQQVVVAGLAARGAGISTGSFEKLRNKFFRACADEAAHCGQ